MKLIFLGAPGAGKGTQAELICEKLNIPQISTGNIIRSEIKAESEIGLKVKSIVESGNLVSDELAVELVKRRLALPDCAGGFVLDGFPRSIPQAEAFDAFETIDKVIVIDVPSEAIIERLSGRRSCMKCGATYHVRYNPPAKEGICDFCEAELSIRSDDQPDVIRDRLEVYHKQTEPLICYYDKQGKVEHINGELELNEVSKQVLDALGIV